MKFNRYLACAYAEGFLEGEGATKEEQIEAWQYIIDTGLDWEMQGRYRRTAIQLIRLGICQPRQNR